MVKISCFTLLLGLIGLMDLRADVVETSDGSRLTGKIISLDIGKIILETSYAGRLEIDQAKVISFSSDKDVFVRLQSGTTILGKVNGSSGGSLSISGPDGTLSTTISKVAATWQPEAQDPEYLRVEAAKAKIEKEAERKWKYDVYLNIGGQNGNSSEFDSEFGGRATLESKNDRFAIGLNIEHEESNNQVTSEEVILDTEYTNFFSEKWGWFIREELEYDEFEDIQLRSTSAGGLTHRVYLRDNGDKLELRGGLSYRHESYISGIPDEQNVGLDFGLDHVWNFAEWGRSSNQVTFTPSVEDFSDYRLVQDSRIEIPLGKSDFWKLGLGLKNEYDNKPNTGLEELDTTYYSRLNLSWE